jgi:hypothetical protein
LALAFAGCGSGDDGTIPPGKADEMLALVTAVQSDVSNGDCERAQAHADELLSQIDQLPNEVDSAVVSELTKAATNLEQLSSSDCVETGASGETAVPSTTSTTESVTSTTTTETSTTTTKPETTTTTKPPEEQPTEDPNAEPPGGQGQGGGGVQPPSGGVSGGGNGG